MIKKIRTVLLSLTIATFGFTAVMAPAVALADSKSAVCEGAGLVAGVDGGCNTSDPTGPSVDSSIKKGMQLFSAIVGIIAVVMFIIGGLKFMTSQGDPGQTNSAKNTLIFAAVGLVIVALAQLFVKFVLQRFTK